MAMFDLYSTRRKLRGQGGEPEVYVYDDVPKKLRVQVAQILHEAMGGCRDSEYYPENRGAWDAIQGVLLREFGVHGLGGSRDHSKTDVLHVIENGGTEHFLDALEACAFWLEHRGKKLGEHDRHLRGITVSAGDAIEELNVRFRQAGVGYQIEADKIVRVDSMHVHREVVVPALRLLSEPRFAGPNDEFLRAHGHYRAGEHDDAVTDANNAFESTMKAICDINGWPYEKGARASDLIKLLRANGFLPENLDASFDQLAATLKSGLPKLRNDYGAHGGGSQVRETPSHVAAYALHLAAAKIVFLVGLQSEREKGTVAA